MDDQTESDEKILAFDVPDEAGNVAGDTRELVSGRGTPLEEPSDPHRRQQGPASRDER
jgi:hypothetical protein